MKEKMLTAKRFAEEIGKPYSTVALWLKDNRIPEVEKHELEGGKVFYLIPASAVMKYSKAENQPKRGRPKTAPNESASAISATEGAAAKPKPAKKATKKGN